MDNTYVTLYENEVRAVEILVRNQYDAAFTPDTANAWVEDIEGTVVVAKKAAMVTENAVTTLIDTEVTVTPGVYHLIWEIVKNTNIFYHKTIIDVKEL